MRNARHAQHIITPCRSRSRLMQSLEEFGLQLPSAHTAGFVALESRAHDRQQVLLARHQANLERIIQLTLERSDQLLSQIQTGLSTF